MVDSVVKVVYLGDHRSMSSEHWLKGLGDLLLAIGDTLEDIIRPVSIVDVVVDVGLGGFKGVDHRVVLKVKHP